MFGAVTRARVLTPGPTEGRRAEAQARRLALAPPRAVVRALHLAIVAREATKTLAGAVVAHAVHGTCVGATLEVTSSILPPLIALADATDGASSMPAAVLGAIVLIAPRTPPSLVAHAFPCQVVASPVVLAVHRLQGAVDLLDDHTTARPLLAVHPRIFGIAPAIASGLLARATPKTVLQARLQTAVVPSPSRVAHARPIRLADTTVQTVGAGALLDVAVEATVSRQAPADTVFACPVLAAGDAHADTAVVPAVAVHAGALPGLHVARSLALVRAVSGA